MTSDIDGGLRDVASRAWDTVVIGAGPAGSLAARKLAQAGRTVLLIERKRFPRGKVCGCCLSQRATQWLVDAGLAELLPSLGAVSTRHYRVACGDVWTELNLPGGAAISREAFDHGLADAAVAAGAVRICGVTATVGPVDSNGSTRSVDLQASNGAWETVQGNVVVVADGLGHTSLNRCPEFATQVAPAARIGVSTALADPVPWLEPGTIGMNVGSAGYVGLVRLEHGGAHLAAALDPNQLKTVGSPVSVVQSILAECHSPPVELPAADTWRGTLPMTRCLARPAAARILVIGDSAGYVEPFTGEGMAWALGSGLQAAQLILDTGFATWSPRIEQHWLDLRSSLVNERQHWCRVLAALARRPRLARWSLRALAAWPSVGQAIVGRLNRPLAIQRVAIS